MHIVSKNTLLRKSKVFIMKKIFSPCPVETTLRLIENKWRVLIIRELLNGTRRFGELARGVGNVSQRSLTMNLRFLEEYGLISRRVYASVPPRVEYSLTPLGESLRPILKAMESWGLEYQKKLK